MIGEMGSGLVHDHKLSSVGPGRASAAGAVHEPGGVDLAMKLHYLRGVYFLGSRAIEGISNMRIKESMFYWLNEYFHTCGRFRRSDSGRPYIKCNDCGARFVEAKCDMTVSEWFQMEDCLSRMDLLVHQHVIGPEISFSPPVFLQVTQFKCGGVALGLSWAHVLGDAFSAADYMNQWAQIATAIQSDGPPKTSPILENDNSKTRKFEIPPNPHPENLPPPLKRVDPVGDHWTFAPDTKMATFTFHITPPQIANLKNKISGPIFESLCAIIWKSIAKVRQGSLEPKNVTVIKKNPKRAKWALANNQIISTVEANFSPKEADPQKLATLLAEQATDQTAQIEEAIEIDHGVSDFIIYGTNLTFVDWQEADFYEFELQGQKPEFVDYNVRGVGENGVVLVLPGAKDPNEQGETERLVTVTLPLGEVSEVKLELENNDLLLHNTIE